MMEQDKILPRLGRIVPFYALKVKPWVMRELSVFYTHIGAKLGAHGR